MEARIALEPHGPTKAAWGDAPAAEHRREQMAEVVREAGGKVVPVTEANALIWLEIGDPTETGLTSILDANPGISWVQLPWAGVEDFASALNYPTTFTCAKSAYGEQVGEHALVLILASLKHLVVQARTLKWNHTEPESLFRKRITILGAGGIATVLISLLQPFACHIRVLRRIPDSVDGANQTLPISKLHQVLPDTDVLVLALALTPQTTHIIGERELSLLPQHGILVNVGRGRLVEQDALINALHNQQIYAAGLDVTEPEPLPADNSLWSFDNVLITSHSGDSLTFVTQKLAERVSKNVASFIKGGPLDGVVDPVAGY